MIVLGIETSCDETSVAVVKDGTEVLSNIVYSQIVKHRPYGGIVPEIASRLHAECIHDLYKRALDQAGITVSDIDVCAVTHGPGLEGSLLVGVMFAKTFSKLTGVPLVPVNHLEGHIYSGFLDAVGSTDTSSQPLFPFISLIVSGGHTQLVRVHDYFNFEIVGQTRDDAAGEAFDKVARLLELGYPGGPVIERLAKEGNPKAYTFPRAMKHQGLDFSFSGLKTAVVQTFKEQQKLGTPVVPEDFCASFQKAVSDILIFKSLKACQESQCSTLLLCGGVTANRTLRESFAVEAAPHNIRLLIPPPSYSTDNAAMIASAGYFKYQHQITTHTEPTLYPDIRVIPNLSL